MPSDYKKTRYSEGKTCYQSFLVTLLSFFDLLHLSVLHPPLLLLLSRSKLVAGPLTAIMRYEGMTSTNAGFFFKKGT